MVRIIIADILSHTYNGKSTGHYFAVARNYQEIFGQKCRVAGGPVYKQRFKNDELIELPHNAGGGGLLARCKTLQNAWKLFQVSKGDVLVLQQCTEITTFLCIFLFYHCKSKLFLIKYSKEGLRNHVGRFLFKLAKKKIDGVICPNDIVGEAYQGIPYCVVPDYICVNNEEKKTVYVPYDQKRYDFCIIGRIAEEKGVVEVAYKLSNTRYNVLIAGKTSTDALGQELHSICDKAENITFIHDYINEEDYIDYLMNSRYAILNYKGEYSERSSGVVFDTLFNGVPVIGRRCKALRFVEERGMGFLYDDISTWNPGKVNTELFYKNCLRKIDQYIIDQYIFIKNISCFLLGDLQ